MISVFQVHQKTHLLLKVNASVINVHKHILDYKIPSFIYCSYHIIGLNSDNYRERHFFQERAISWDQIWNLIESYVPNNTNTTGKAILLLEYLLSCDKF